jgi:hypothetical protein
MLYGDIIYLNHNMTSGYLKVDNSLCKSPATGHEEGILNFV